MADKAKFAVRQRIVVPGFPGVQGIITSVLEHAVNPPSYAVSYFTHDGTPASVSLTEGDLVFANPNSSS
jgi:hypothetical protein